MNIIESVSEVNQISESRNYWFVRTDSGINFESFVEGNFIGIGWNYISIFDIENSSASGIEIKTKIARSEKIDITLAKGKGKVTGIYNKLIKFNKLNKGDIVIIPSNSSSRLAFGVIEDDVIYSDPEKSYACDYFKRRRVNWVHVGSIKELDPMFYQITVSQHAISSIDKYATYIDAITNSLYYKLGSGHFVLDIGKHDDINLITLISLIDSIQKIEQEINQKFNLSEDIENTSIKLNVQSPGKIVIKVPSGKTLVLFVSLLILGGCTANQDNVPELNIPQQQREAIQSIIDENQDSLDAISRGFIELQVKTDKINQIINHGSN